MPVDGTLRSIFINVALLGALASTACMWDGDVVVGQVVRSPSGDYFVEHMRAGVTAPISSSTTLISIVKDDRRWFPDERLIAMLNHSQPASIHWRSDSEVLVEIGGEARQLDLIEVGPSRFKDVRIVLSVGSEVIDQEAWNRMFHSGSELLTEGEAELLVMHTPKALELTKDGWNLKAKRGDSQDPNVAVYDLIGSPPGAPPDQVASYWVNVETWEVFEDKLMVHPIDSYELRHAQAITFDRRAR